MLTSVTRLALVLAALIASAAPVHAASITFDLDIEFSGGADPLGPTPWLTATLDDSFGGPNTVRLTLSAINLVDDESAIGWYLNFDPNLDASQLVFNAIDVSAVGPTTVTGSNNAYQADGDGFFDILFDFPPPPGNDASRLTSGESVIYDITYIAPIDVNSFNYFSVMGGGNGSYLSAAHVTRIGQTNDSGWVGAVPEPGTAVLLGMGLVGLGLRRRRS